MQNNNQMAFGQVLGDMNNRINNLTTKVDGVLNLMIEQLQEMDSFEVLWTRYSYKG